VNISNSLPVQVQAGADPEANGRVAGLAGERATASTPVTTSAETATAAILNCLMSFVSSLAGRDVDDREGNPRGAAIAS
jgi:hypothetical protein